jgi:hypothetical protein
MKTRPPRQPWHLKAQDFTKKRAYAQQNWRFQMFFEYLRISPSYALALNTLSEEALIKQLGDELRAHAIWQTCCDMGDVNHMLYKEWWLEKGLGLFGVHTQKPRIEVIHRIGSDERRALILSNSQAGIEQYLKNHYRQQGRPDSLLLSIPLGLNRTTTIKQLKKLLTEMETQQPPSLPIPAYQLENNKMRYRRLLAGLRLLYMRAARPNEALWRIATRAKISHSHGRLNPEANKKDNTNPDARRMLTIMASRLLHDTLVIAENAATGVFPSLAPINTDFFDATKLKIQLADTSKWEKVRKAELLELAKNKSHDKAPLK